MGVEISLVMIQGIPQILCSIPDNGEVLLQETLRYEHKNACKSRPRKTSKVPFFISLGISTEGSLNRGEVSRDLVADVSQLFIFWKIAIKIVFRILR